MTSRPKRDWDPTSPNNVQTAVARLAGPTVLLGPAGSGKTTALVELVAHLLASGVPTEQILVLAVSRRSADDLSQRFAVRLAAAPP